mmetsp:Transcript_10741/g.23453  ORF Transcript_10741/g.23453 Transcript_10741/m.23453 type:complete len:142 (-) Transcript_10741:417-842(-)
MGQCNTQPACCRSTAGDGDAVKSRRRDEGLGPSPSSAFDEIEVVRAISGQAAALALMDKLQGRWRVLSSQRDVGELFGDRLFWHSDFDQVPCDMIVVGKDKVSMLLLGEEYIGQVEDLEDSSKVQITWSDGEVWQLHIEDC